MNCHDRVRIRKETKNGRITMNSRAFFHLPPCTAMK
jgi:hypothetical protein